MKRSSLAGLLTAIIILAAAVWYVIQDKPAASDLPNNGMPITVLTEGELQAEPQIGWVRSTNEDLGIRFDHPADFIYAGTTFTHAPTVLQGGGLGIYAYGQEEAMSVNAYLSARAGSTWANTREDWQIGDLQLTRIETKLPGYPDARCPEYLLQTEETLINFYLFECLEWQDFDAVMQSVRSL